MPKVEAHSRMISTGTPPTNALLNTAAEARAAAARQPNNTPHTRRPIIGETIDTTILPATPAPATRTKYPAAVATGIPSSNATIVEPQRYTPYAAVEEPPQMITVSQNLSGLR